MKNTSSQPLPVRRTVCSEMANDGKQNSRRVHCSRPTACTSMTMVFEGIRSQRIDRKGQGSQALRVGGLRGDLVRMHSHTGSAGRIRRGAGTRVPLTAGGASRPSTSRLEGLYYTPLDLE